MRQRQPWQEWRYYKDFKYLPQWWDLDVDEPLSKMRVRVMCDREVVEKTLARCRLLIHTREETVKLLSEALEGSASLIALYGSYNAIDYARMCGLTPAKEYGFTLYHQKGR